MDLDALLDDPALPTLPDIVVRLNELINHNAGLEELADLIKYDQTLTVRCIEMANSAWYHRQKPAVSVDEAIAHIGIASLSRLVLAVTVTTLFKDINPALVTMRTHWEGSARMAVAAGILAEDLGKIPPGLLFISGLLCQVGKLVYYAALPDVAEKILEASRRQGIQQHHAELDVLGFHHATISSALFRRWQFPEQISHMVEYYLEPEQAPGASRLAPSVLNIAGLMTVFKPDEGLQVEIDEGNLFAMKETGMARDNMGSLYDDTEARLAEALKLFL
jgi:HD-like signal output (HDOD) protein